MPEKTPEEILSEELSGEDRTVAEAFTAFLRENNFEFYRDRGYWRDKIYYWIKHRGECVCFIAVRDPEEPENRWTVWSDDLGEEFLSDESAGDGIKTVALRHVDECGHCGACGGGKPKRIFGKDFRAVCGCTFRLDNPEIGDLPFLKYMVQLRQKQIEENGRT